MQITGQTQVFLLSKNIGYDSRNAAYEGIKVTLADQKKVNFWIKGAESEKWNPTIFQIAKEDGTIIYSINDTSSEVYFLFPL